MTTKTPKRANGPKTLSMRARAKRRSAAERPASAVASVRKKLGLSRKVFSRLTGYSERAIANWESGGSPDEPGLRRIRETERFQAKLAEVVRPEEIPQWLDTPNDAFDGLKPIEVIERGEIDRLWNMVFYLESGIAS
jgi:DNA-binding transcriptional regulator YiaG